MSSLSPTFDQDTNAAYAAGPGRDDWIGETVRQAWADGHFKTFSEWVVKHRDFGNGHRECIVFKRHVDAWKEFSKVNWPSAVAKRGAGLDRDESIKKSAQRAKTQCRLVCKTLLVNSLWTLTYKQNVQDRSLVVAHLKEFVRRVRRVLPDLRYVWTLEKQDRGAYHVHMATHSLPKVMMDHGVSVKSWDLMRRIWRSVVGQLGGNFDESKNKRDWRRKGSTQRTSAAIARYISKYVTKSFMDEQDLNKKRWNHSDVTLPPAVRHRFSADCHVAELIELAYAAVGERITCSWWDRGRECFYIETDDSALIGVG